MTLTFQENVLVLHDIVLKAQRRKDGKLHSLINRNDILQQETVKYIEELTKVNRASQALDFFNDMMRFFEDNSVGIEEPENKKIVALQLMGIPAAEGDESFYETPTKQKLQRTHDQSRGVAATNVIDKALPLIIKAIASDGGGEDLQERLFNTIARHEIMGNILLGISIEVENGKTTLIVPIEGGQSIVMSREANGLVDRYEAPFHPSVTDKTATGSSPQPMPGPI